MDPYVKGRCGIFTYFGGKTYLLDRMYAKFPAHEHFADVFGGSAKVLLNHTRCTGIEILNDLNPELVTVYKTVRDKPRELADVFESIKLGPESWKEWQQKKPQNDIETTVRIFYVHQMSWGGLTESYRTGTRERRGIDPHHSAWLRCTERMRLWRYSLRLKNTIIENKHYADIFAAYDMPGMFFYLDPPYMRETRRSGDYAFDSINHAYFLEKVKQLKFAKVMISGYDHPFYDSQLKGWNKCKFIGVYNRSSAKKKLEPSNETIWMNY